MTDTSVRALRVVGWSMLPLAALTLTAPWLPVSPAVGALLAFGCATASIVLAAALTPRALITPRRVAFGVVLGGVALSLASTRLPDAPGALVGALGLLAAACVVGAQVGMRVEAPGHILPVALLSAAVDILSVTAPRGPTHIIVQTPALLKLLTVRASMPPLRTPEPQIGFGDVVFASLYAAVGARFALSAARTYAALAVGLVAAGVTAAALQAPVPALPMLGLAMVAVHPEARRVPPRDRGAAAFAALALLASVARVVLTMAR